MKRSICGMIIVALLASMIVAVIHVQPVKAGTITVPDDYATIQEAINAASSGDTIFVRNGTYYESVIVNRTVTLLGENPEATVVYANRTGDCLNVTAYGVTVTGFTLQNGGSIYSSLSLFSDGNNITGNTLIDSWCGVFLSFYCQNEIIENNKIEDNLNGISGQLLSDVRIIGNDIRNNLMGIWLGPYCSNSVVSFNNLADSWTQGLYTYAPSYCTFEGNNIASNNQAQWSAGLTLAFQVPYSYGNRFFHNNIANIGQQIELQMATADQLTLDDGYPKGGNYWSDYNGTDSNGDGIGDTPYVINSEDQDNYPLMSPYEYWINPILGDVNRDMKVDMKDIELCCDSFCAKPNTPRWNPHCDLNEDGFINMRDIGIACLNFGQHYP